MIDEGLLGQKPKSDVYAFWAKIRHLKSCGRSSKYDLEHPLQITPKPLVARSPYNMTNGRGQSPKQWIRISQGTVDKGATSGQKLDILKNQRAGLVRWPSR